ncbi:unnamed protein product [Bubo scandiacus]
MLCCGELLGTKARSHRVTPALGLLLVKLVLLQIKEWKSVKSWWPGVPSARLGSLPSSHLPESSRARCLTGAWLLWVLFVVLLIV